MKRRLLPMAGLFLSGMMCFSAVGCGSSKKASNDGPFTALSPKNGSGVSIVNSEIENFLEQEELVGALVDAYVTKEDCFFPKSIVLSWECEQALTDCTITVATDKAFTKNVSVYNDACNNSSVIENGYTNCEYFWKINGTTESGETLESSIFSFKVKATPRPVYIDGVSNTRDIGGYNVAGGKVKQGMIYRTAKFDDITPQGLLIANEMLEIKTDLDLRNVGEGTAGAQSPLGCENYLRLTSPYYAIFDDDQKAQVRDIMQVFADETNYPIAMHCSLGRDRTGTIAFLLNALLGVERTDLRVDYFLSCFSKAGTALDSATYVQLENNFNNMYYGLEDGYKGDTYAEKVENYLLSAGVTVEEIEKIKDIMLEEN
ncbi:MAG: tyrosine-protein phosphatase [Clostridia bacterium]|nr:tyrosine-protein phosphatase [Clostridia bacterium]